MGLLLAALVSIPLAMASLRVKGQFLIVITYAFCEILRFIAINTAALGGTAGIPGLKSPEIFGIKNHQLAASSKAGYDPDPVLDRSSSSIFRMENRTFQDRLCFFGHQGR